MSTAPGTQADRQAPSASMGTDIGLLILRVVIGGLFIGHGTGKLFGWFGQGGIKGTSAFFEQVGYEPSKPLVILDGIVEVGAGVALICGFLVPLAAGALIGDMGNAAWVKSAAGFWVADNGLEYELVLIVLMLALSITGAGAFALDRGKNWPFGRTGGFLVAVILGVVSGGILAFIRE